VPAEAGEAHRRMARGNRHRRINNQELRQWPLRERWSAATQLSAGVPSSPTRHSSGKSDIGCSSSSITRRSRSSIACLAPTRRAGRRPERIHRRTVSGFLPSRSAASATVNMEEMVRQAPDPRLRAPSNMDDQRRSAATTPFTSTLRPIHRLASTYRPLATRTNRGEEPETLAAKAPLTELHATTSPSIASTAAWISRARIGSPWQSKTWTRAPTTHSGRRPRSRWLRTTRSCSPLARTAASFPANRANDPCRS
jgi:hypothetical protein